MNRLLFLLPAAALAACQSPAPATGERPSETTGNLIIGYDPAVGIEPLLAAASDYRAEILYATQSSTPSPSNRRQTSTRNRPCAISKRYAAYCRWNPTASCSCTHSNKTGRLKTRSDCSDGLFNG